MKSVRTAAAWQFRDESWPYDEWSQITREQYEHMAAGNVTGERGKHWEIRELYDLWEIAVPGWVVDALDTANAMLTAQGYAHTDLRAARDFLAKRVLPPNT